MKHTVISELELQNLKYPHIVDSMHTLHTDLHTFLKVPTRIIRLTINNLLSYI